MASESQLPYRQVNICASLEMTTKWIPARKPPISPSLTKDYDLFMQNEANFRKSQVNVNLYNIMNYEEKSDWTFGENEPKTNPIKANFRKAQMNVNSLITKDYRKNDAFAVQKNKPNSNPISVKAKMSANVFVTKDYENETAFRLQKNKPKTNPTCRGVASGEAGSNPISNFLLGMSYGENYVL